MPRCFTSLLFLIILSKHISAQSFSSYFTGDTTDVTAITQKGVCLMGGAGEDDNAMKWFLQRAGGGDILVLRADDSDGYNDYLFSELGIAVNSVETIVCNDASASDDAYVINQIKNAEAIFFAGGDQWNYVSYWRDTPVEDAINYCINEKGITIGGLSAGMAIQGQAVFTAENGSVSSFQALSNPYSTLMTLAYDDFIEDPLMENIITDTHFDNPDRRGRTTAFLARMYNDYGLKGYAIACEEYTSVCIDENKIATAYGRQPLHEDYVYFVQVNCPEPSAPEVIEDGEQLTWLRNNAALKVAKMEATKTGTETFDLNDWKTATGTYTWQDWWVDDGSFQITENAAAIDCSVTINNTQSTQNSAEIFPNPSSGRIFIRNNDQPFTGWISLRTSMGESVREMFLHNGVLDIEDLPSGIYFLQLMVNNGRINDVFLKE